MCSSTWCENAVLGKVCPICANPKAGLGVVMGVSKDPRETITLGLIFIFVAHPSKHVKSSHYRPVSETPSELRLADGPIGAQDWMLAGM